MYKLIATRHERRERERETIWRLLFAMADTAVVKSLLQLLENLNDGIDSLEAARSLSVDHQLIVGAVKSLQASGNVSV